MSKLCLGTFFKAILRCKITSRTVTQKNIVGDVMHLVDSQFDEFDDSMISNIAIGKKNPSGYVMEVVNNFGKEMFDELIDGFKNICSYIDPNRYDECRNLICYIIENDENIKNDTIVELCGEISKNQLRTSDEPFEKFLAGIFIYVLKYTNNKDSKQYANEVLTIETSVFMNPIIAENKVDPLHDNELEQIKLRFFSDKYFTAVGAATAIGNWDEGNKLDVAMIERLTGKSYIDFIEELKMEPECNCSHHKEIYIVESVFALRKNLIADMHKAHFEKIFDEFGNILRNSTAYDRPSDELLQSVYDFMAFSGVYIGKNDRVKRTDYRNMLYGFLTSMFKNNQENVKLIISGLEMLVEVDSRMVLRVVSDYAINENSIVSKLVMAEKGSGIIYPLSNAIRKAAAIPESFSVAMDLLFDLAKYNDVFLDNVVYVFLPGYPQTSVDMDIKR